MVLQMLWLYSVLYGLRYGHPVDFFLWIDATNDVFVGFHHWEDVIWAMTTRMDPVRDTLLVENTPIDYLDFASPDAGLGGKIGMDATSKWPSETKRPWGEVIEPCQETIDKINAIWPKLGL